MGEISDYKEIWRRYSLTGKDEVVIFFDKDEEAFFRGNRGCGVLRR